MSEIARGLLANDLIQTWTVYAPGDDRSSSSLPRVTSRTEAVIRSLNLNVSDEELLRISKEGVLALNLEEMQAIRDFFCDLQFRKMRRGLALGTEITDCELEVLAQTWSEHCKHKIFNARIEYHEAGRTRRIDSLFRTYIQGSTEKIRRELGDRDFCLSVFKDNAGVIRFDNDWNLVFKVETHNSPSALDPVRRSTHRDRGGESRSFWNGSWFSVDLQYRRILFCSA